MSWRKVLKVTISQIGHKQDSAITLYVHCANNFVYGVSMYRPLSYNDEIAFAHKALQYEQTKQMAKRTTELKQCRPGAARTLLVPECMG